MLAGVGATVVCADINLERAAETADKILADGGKATSVGCDASSRADVEDLVLGAVAAHGRLDVMGNIAGIIHESSVVDTDEADLDRVLATNLKGVFFGCQSAARVMIEQGSGSIINMSSGAIDTPAPGIVCYAMAKAAVAQLTKTLAAEVGPSGVRVNAHRAGADRHRHDQSALHPSRRQHRRAGQGGVHHPDGGAGDARPRRRARRHRLRGAVPRVPTRRAS